MLYLLTQFEILHLSLQLDVLTTTIKKGKEIHLQIWKE